MRTFRITERDLDAGCREIRLEGELDLSVADRLQARLDAVVADDVDALVCVDECDFIDSTGIAVIVLAHRLMEDKGRRLFVCDPSPEVRRVLDITGLIAQGIVFESTDAALAERFGRVASRPFRASRASQKLSAANGDPPRGRAPGKSPVTDSATTAPASA
jgi:anti-anti-sigma factor